MSNAHFALNQPFFLGSAGVATCGAGRVTGGDPGTGLLAAGVDGLAREARRG